MASRKRRCLTSEENLDLVFESDEDDDCDDPEFTMDIESSDSDSDNDAEASDSEEPLDYLVPVAPPPSKAPRLDACSNGRTTTVPTKSQRSLSPEHQV